MSSVGTVVFLGGAVLVIVSYKIREWLEGTPARDFWAFLTFVGVMLTMGGIALLALGYFR